MNFDDIKRGAEWDQAQAANDQWGRFLVDRYRALRGAGIPDPLASLMVRDLNWVAAVKGFYPDTPPLMAKD